MEELNTLKMETEATQRISACRAKVQQAAGNAEQTAEFEKRIIQFYTAAGRGESDATTLAAEVRAYIEAVPDLLERLLQSVREPGVPDAWVTKRMAILNVALDAFESSSAVPDHFGLAGLLDNGYLASRLLPEEFQVGLDHEHANQILGPLTILQLDQRVSEIRAALAAGVKVGDSGPSPLPTPAFSQAHGDCVDCVHMRYGTPVVQAVFDNLLDALRASAREDFTQKLREERQMSGQFLDELEALKRSEDTHYTRRPTERRIMYCGVEEFDGVHQCCEVKNLDQQCTQFVAKPAQPPTRACATCRHHYQIPSGVFHMLQQVAGRIATGKGIRDEIKKTLEMQAQSEFGECVEYGGFLQSARPGTLPHCEARSTAETAGEARYVVGPVANVAKQCDRWEAGDNENIRRLTLELSALDADAKRAWQDRSNPPVLESSWVTYSDRLLQAAVNADADVLEYGLNVLGVHPSSVESICIGYVADVGQTGMERTTRASRPRQSDADAGYRRKEAPFVIEAGKIYRHPEEYRVTVECHFDRDMVDVRDEFNTPCQFQISAFPPGSWQGLAGASGQRLRAALMVSRNPDGSPVVYAAWL
jgi:hypothetical protein